MIHISRAGDGRVSVSIDGKAFIRVSSVFVNNKHNILTGYSDKLEVVVIKFDVIKIDDTGLKSTIYGPYVFEVIPE